MTEVLKLPLRSFAGVFRPEADKWEGPFKLLAVSGETCTLLVPTSRRGSSEFRTTVVKPYVPTISPSVLTTPDSPTVHLRVRH